MSETMFVVMVGSLDPGYDDEAVAVAPTKELAEGERDRLKSLPFCTDSVTIWIKEIDFIS